MARGTPFVATGEPIMCTMGAAINQIKVTSQQVKKLGGKLQATDADKTPPGFLQTPGCFGTCSATGGKPCQAQISIAGNWLKTDTHYTIKGHHPLTVASQLLCSKGGIIKFQYAELTTVIEHALVAAHAYYRPGKDLKKDAPLLPPGTRRLKFSEYPKDLQNPELWEDKDSGLRAHLYLKENDEYIVAFRGTENVKDWSSNYIQGIGLKEKQYEKANKLALDLENSSIADQTSIAGHSLGGGLASLAGAQTQLSTYTFNSAGLHRNTLARWGLDASDTAGVQDYYGDDDILNMVQNSRKKLLSLLPSSLRYGPKEAAAGSALGETAGGATGGFAGSMAEVPPKALGNLMEAGGKANQMAADLVEGPLRRILDVNPITCIPVVKRMIAAGQRSIGRAFAKLGEELQEFVDPFSDWTGRHGQTAGKYAGGAAGGAVGTAHGLVIDSSPVSKAIDVNTTGDLPQAKGVPRRIMTDAPNPGDKLNQFLKQLTVDEEELKKLMENAKAGHKMAPLIAALKALQARGAKHYTTSK